MSADEHALSLFARTIDVVYSTRDVWAGMPYVLAAAGIFGGGIVVWAFVMWMIEWVAFRSERRRFWAITGVDPMKKQVRWSVPRDGVLRNFGHLLLASIFFIGIVFIVWIATSIVGLNPWSSAAATLSLGVLLTYGFAGLLGHISAGLTTLATNSIAVGQYWEFAGQPGYDGYIHSIEKVAVYMTRFNEDTKQAEIIYMPMSMFTNAPRKRIPGREERPRTGITELDPVQALAKRV